MTGAAEQLARFDAFASEPAASGALRYVLLDVFAEAPLEGNQLAVFLDGRGLDGERMQSLAREMKLSESVFVLPSEQQGDVRIRIFTPSAELPFAGHPVLGSAVVVASALGRERVVLETGGGPIGVALGTPEGRSRSGEMSQPVPSWAPFAAPAELLAALGIDEGALLPGAPPAEEYRNGPRHVMVVLRSEQAVVALDPDLSRLARVTGEAGVSCFAGAGGRFKSRMFAPGLGVPEDPATGSAAGPLAVHACLHGLAGFGTPVEIRQGAEIGRPSLLHARVMGSAEHVDSVLVGGRAVLLGQGELRLD